MKPETCEICKGPVPTTGNCSLPIEWGEKNFYVCSPQCEFNLGRRMGAEGRVCEICKGKVPAEDPYRKPMNIEGKDYYICSPKCAFELGWNHLGEVIRFDLGDA